MISISNNINKFRYDSIANSIISNTIDEQITYNEIEYNIYDIFAAICNKCTDRNVIGLYNNKPCFNTIFSNSELKRNVCCMSVGSNFDKTLFLSDICKSFKRKGKCNIMCTIDYLLNNDSNPIIKNVIDNSIIVVLDYDKYINCLSANRYSYSKSLERSGNNIAYCGESIPFIDNVYRYNNSTVDYSYTTIKYENIYEKQIRDKRVGEIINKVTGKKKGVRVGRKEVVSNNQIRSIERTVAHLKKVDNIKDHDIYLSSVRCISRVAEELNIKDTSNYYVHKSIRNLAMVAKDDPLKHREYTGNGTNFIIKSYINSTNNTKRNDRIATIFSDNKINSTMFTDVDIRKLCIKKEYKQINVYGKIYSTRDLAKKIYSDIERIEMYVANSVIPDEYNRFETGLYKSLTIENNGIREINNEFKQFIYNVMKTAKMYDFDNNVVVIENETTEKLVGHDINYLFRLWDVIYAGDVMDYDKYVGMERYSDMLNNANQDSDVHLLIFIRNKILPTFMEANDIKDYRDAFVAYVAILSQRKKSIMSILYEICERQGFDRINLGNVNNLKLVDNSIRPVECKFLFIGSPKKGIELKDRLFDSIDELIDTISKRVNMKKSSIQALSRKVKCYMDVDHNDPECIIDYTFRRGRRREKQLERELNK